ncbi:hypothetical protein AX15_004018 [Amanita polypyramis BW_CC]|nr:hypothetical protein AX15_004018 [Amanita polypyramis BW_CC]
MDFLFDDQPPIPHTLEDQVYAAYALDDIHQAKVLLLKLKGIDVTSDNDPRIAAVQDEDFDVCFIPNGRLISEEEEKELIEAQHREHRRRQRQERLRACEHVWDHVRRRMHEERLWLQRRRDLEEWKRVAEEAERLRALREREALAVAQVRAHRKASQHNVNSCETLTRNTSQSSAAEDPFVYDATVHSAPSSPTWNRRMGTSTPSALRPTRSHLQVARPVLDGCPPPVSFKEVIASLEGALFPLTVEEKRSYKTHPHQRHTELLDSLLQTDWESMEDCLKRCKGGELDVRPMACRRSSCSSDSSCSSLTSSGSWLSFVSRSSGSTSLATPPLPIISTWLRRPNTSVVRMPVYRLCRPRSQHIPVPLTTSPLYDVGTDANIEFGNTKKDRCRPGRRRHNLTGAANAVVNGLGHLIDAAKQLQKAYMIAATHNAAGLTSGYDHHYEDDYKLSRGRPAGMRAQSKDIKTFLGNTTLPPVDASVPMQYIPLVSPFPPQYPPRTVLPDPLPYRMTFKPHPPVSRSPFRWQKPEVMEKELNGYRSSHADNRPQKLRSTALDAHMHGETNLRIRLVSNPAYLRLMALENIIYERGLDWEGRGRNYGFSNGRETMHGVAVEGLGRSPLSVC